MRLITGSFVGKVWAVATRGAATSAAAAASDRILRIRGGGFGVAGEVSDRHKLQNGEGSRWIPPRFAEIALETVSPRRRPNGGYSVMLSSWTMKMIVEFGGMPAFPPTPYPSSEGMTISRWPCTRMPIIPSRSPNGPLLLKLIGASLSWPNSAPFLRYP